MTHPEGTSRRPGGIHADVLGDGEPLLALHGAYSTRGEVRGFLEPALGARRDDLRRIYPDLPGMGDSSGSGFARGADVVAALVELLEAEAGATPAWILGHSYGGLLARALVASLPAERVRGLALICPMVPEDMTPAPVHLVDEDPAETLAAILPDPAHLGAFRDYFVVRTAETARRFRELVAPSLGSFDDAAVERIMGDSRFDPDPARTPYAGPTLVLVGRHDAVVGCGQLDRLVRHHPRATGVVAGDCGHALPHERPGLLAALLEDWLAQR